MTLTDFLLTTIVFLLVVFVGLLFWVTWKLGDLLDYARSTQTGVSNLHVRLSTRQSRAHMRNGAKTEEDELRELGHASEGARVVAVGGDPDSRQKQDLESRRSTTRVWAGGDFEEEEDKNNG